MSSSKPTLKSLEKLIMEFRADHRKDLSDLRKTLSEEMRELKEECSIQKKKVIELEESVKFISGGFDKLEKENKF